MDGLTIDASLVVSALLDSGPEGTWASDLLCAHALCAPHHLPVECSNIIRRTGCHSRRSTARLGAATGLQCEVLVPPNP